MKYSLLDFETVLRSWGKAVVLRAPVWTPAAGDPLNLTHLGMTEGDVTVALNPEVAHMTLPEVSGPAVHEADVTGENPTVELPLFLADPALLSLVSPLGSAHGGRVHRTAAAEHTLVLFPEALFYTQDLNGKETAKDLEFAAGAWKLGGLPLTAAQLTMLDQSMWLWRGYFTRAQRRYLGGAGNDRKQIEKVTFQVMHHPDMPEGNHLFTTGDPADENIDIEGGS